MTRKAVAAALAALTAGDGTHEEPAEANAAAVELDIV
jgi:hypothetical protein